MTTQEMIDGFLLDYDLNGSAAVAGFTDAEILLFLNKGQIDLVKDLFLRLGPAPLQKLIDHQSLTGAGGSLLTAASAGYNNANAWTAAFPSDYLFYINSRTFLIRSSLPAIVSYSWIENKEIEKEDTSKFIESETNLTNFYNPVIFSGSNNFTVIVDSLTTVKAAGAGVSNFMLSYLREPVAITAGVSCELNVKWHQEIVNLAVRNAMLVTNDFRLRSNQPDKSEK